jgi:hypothetical protein
MGTLVTVGVLVSLNLGPSMATSSPPTGLSTLIEAEAAAATQNSTSTAYLVVRFAENDAIVRAITVTEPITAYRALELADLDPVVAETAFGLLLCGIDGVGQAKPNGTECDNGTRYWGTSYWQDGAWAGRLVGVDSAVISQAGHVEGFSFSDPNWTPVNPPPAPPLVAAADALEWLHGQQQADGSFGSLNDTAEVLMAVGANKLDASTWRNASSSLFAYAISRGTEFAEKNAAGAGKLATALAAQESYWPVDALRPLDYYDPMSGTYDSATLYHAWAMLGTASLSETVPLSATKALKDLQLPNGGWEWTAEWGADTNNTALALQALIAAGEPVTSTSVVSGLAYLDAAQNADGGFPYSPDSPYGTDSDTNSTAYAVQALVATGEDPLTGTWAISDANPISYLLSMQLPDGSFEWQPGYGGNQFATQQAVPALLNKTFPLSIEELEAGYGIAGQAVTRIGGTERPLTGVMVEAEGAGDLFFAATDAAGRYTISVPSAGNYGLTPFREGFTFAPSTQTAAVTGTPGDIIPVSDFAGEARVCLPLIMRH